MQYKKDRDKQEKNPMKANILVVDDEKDMTRLLQRTLEPELGCKVTMAFSGEMALNLLEQACFNLVICEGDLS